MMRIIAELILRNYAGRMALLALAVARQAYPEYKSLVFLIVTHAVTNSPLLLALYSMTATFLCGSGLPLCI